MDDPVVTAIAQGFIPLTDGGIRFYSFIEDLVTVPLNKRVCFLFRFLFLWFFGR